MPSVVSSWLVLVMSGASPFSPFDSFSCFSAISLFSDSAAVPSACCSSLGFWTLLSPSAGLFSSWLTAPCSSLFPSSVGSSLFSSGFTSACCSSPGFWAILSSCGTLSPSCNSAFFSPSLLTSVSSLGTSEFSSLLTLLFSFSSGVFSSDSLWFPCSSLTASPSPASFTGSALSDDSVPPSLETGSCGAELSPVSGLDSSCATGSLPCGGSVKNPNYN